MLYFLRDVFSPSAKVILLVLGGQVKFIDSALDYLYPNLIFHLLYGCNYVCGWSDFAGVKQN